MTVKRKKEATWICEKGHKVNPMMEIDAFWKVPTWRRLTECPRCSTLLSDLICGNFKSIFQDDLKDESILMKMLNKR